MTKAEIIKVVADSTGQDKRTVADIFNAFLFEIKEMLISGREVRIAGFGTFDVRERKGRIGRNPRTGEEIVIPAQNLAHFKPAKAFRYALK